MLFFYVTRTEYVAIAGKAISGWKDPHQPVAAPTVEAFVCDENRDEFEMFAQELFRHTSLESLHRPDGHILNRNTFIASLLQYLAPFDAFVGEKDPVMHKIRSAARTAGIRFDVLLEWGEMVQQRFENDNAAQDANSRTHPEIVEAMRAQSSNFRDVLNKLRDTKAAVWAMEKRLAQVEKNAANHAKRSDAKLDR